MSSNIPPAPSFGGAGGTNSPWYGGTTYVSSSDVLSYLQIQNPTTSDTSLLDNLLIPTVCEYIDTITGLTWGNKTVHNAMYSLGKPMYLGWYLVGTPIYLQNKPIIPVSPTQTLLNFSVWNGSQYQEWIGALTEARWGSYWVDTYRGIVWVIGWYWYMGYEIQIDYNYGYNTAGTNQLDGQIKLLALLKSAKLFLDNNRYTAEISQGIGGIEMTDLWNYLNTAIPKLEDAVRGLKTITMGWVP